MMIKKVDSISNMSSIVVVSMSNDDDILKFAGDLRDNLDDFVFKSFSESNSIVNFISRVIDIKPDGTVSYSTKEFSVSYLRKVLIKNRMIIVTDCTSLIASGILILK